jgi:hypothetical protein
MGGGFSGAVGVRVQQGDLTLLSAGDPNAQGLPFAGTLTANSISLTADTGTVDIGGVLSAPSTAQRGHIVLSGSSVVLESSGALHADGNGAAGLGGEIEVNAGSCAGCGISLYGGSVISSAGSGGMGEVILRAAALPSTNDVAINAPGTGITGLGADFSRAGQVVIDAVLPAYTAGNGVSGQNLADNLPNDVQDASNFLTAATTPITQRLVTPSKLGATPTAPLVEAGVVLVDANPADSMTLSSIDLSSYSQSPAQGGLGQVINVSVRTAGTLSVNGTLSDGFIADPTGNTNNRPALTSTPSASFSLVAGADVTSADPLATLRGSTASLTLQSAQTAADYTNGLDAAGGPSVVRTGTGDINLAAAGNIVFAYGPGGVASAYTGGLAPSSDGNPLLPVGFPTTNVLMNFGTEGGAVRLLAGGNVIGAPVGGGVPGVPQSAFDPSSDGGNYGVTGWLFRQGNLQYPTEYGVDYGNFDWNVGSFGGGDVTVSAGGGITNLSAAVADSYVSAANSLNGQATAYGSGGGLVIHAGGDIASPQIYVASGTGVITAGGGLTTNLVYTPPNSQSQGGAVAIGGAIALGDSQVSVWARNGLQIDAIYDPTLVSQISNDPELASNPFLTYGAGSSVTLSATNGDVYLNESASPASSNTLAVIVGNKTIGNFSDLPPTLTVQASQGDIWVNGGSQIDLTPASLGQLNLFAARDIGFSSSSAIVMSDAVPSTLPTGADPNLVLSLVAFQGVVHTGDPNPALITAGQDLLNLNLEIPKAAQIVAGRDIDNLSYQGQNTSAGDVTLVAAGRDYSSPSLTAAGLVLGGPGSFDLLAGRNVNFGFGGGLVTVGDLKNGDLPTAAGADVNLMVGYGSEGADLSGFLDKIIDPSPVYQAQLVSYVESLNGASGESFAQASADFAGFTTAQQSALIDSVFFNELLLSGRAANSGTGVGFTEGYAAIDALFPDSRSPSGGVSPYSGNLSLTSSQVYTESGGNISILVPGGGIDVGLANVPANFPKKNASQLGIVAEGTGNVDIYALNDVNVNTSRIFTLGGGNVLIWSTLGSIDAGNGSKSSLSVPPPTITVNTKTGVVTQNFGASLAAGSGIRTIQTNSTVPPGDVDLDAPVGTVNAGDAGIGASGNINIAAAHVIGVDNINFGGTATGVPSDVSSLGATLSGASAVGAGTTNSSTNAAQEGAGAAKETAPIAQAALSWLDVFVTGLGEENCKPDDLDCLKRQKAAAP